MPRLATLPGLVTGGLLLLVATACSTVKPLPPLTEQELTLLHQLGGEVTPEGNLRLGQVTILRRERELSFPAKVNQTKDDLEVLICTEHGRRHESLLVCSVKAFDLQFAMLLLGWENGTRKPGLPIAQGELLAIEVQPDGGARLPIEHWLFNKTANQVQTEPTVWVFIGSSFDSSGRNSAEIDGNIVNLWSFGGTVVDNATATGDDDDCFRVATENVAPFQTPVTVFMRRLPKPAEPVAEPPPAPTQD